MLAPDANREFVRTSKRKQLFFRLFAMGIGLLPFLFFEWGLLVVGWQPSNSVVDPFVGFSELRPLFVKDGDRFVIAENRRPLFQTDSFATKKSVNEFRIFCLGGSTVQGRPFSIETSFTTWLEINLNTADPSRDWNCINCGGVSYASYRLVPIMEEVLGYDPDMIILCTGHNEFLEDRTYQSVKSVPGWARSVHDWLSCLRTYSLMRELAVGRETATDADNKIVFPAEVEARLDFRGGMEKYVRDDAWKSDVMAHFESNFRRMIEAALSRGIQLVVMNPVSNLKNTAPFKSQSIPPTENLHASSELIRRLEHFPENANLLFETGQALMREGELQDAKDYFIRAKDCDLCPLRIQEPMRAFVASMASEKKLPYLDVQQLFESLSDDGIVGQEFLVDHVHPSIRGHQLIADSLFDVLQKSIPMTKVDEFEAVRDLRFQAHLEALPFMYFQRGKDRLAGLKRWVRGEVRKEK